MTHERHVRLWWVRRVNHTALGHSWGCKGLSGMSRCPRALTTQHRGTMWGKQRCRQHLQPCARQPCKRTVPTQQQWKVTVPLDTGRSHWRLTQADCCRNRVKHNSLAAMKSSHSAADEQEENQGNWAGQTLQSSWHLVTITPGKKGTQSSIILCCGLP